MHPKFTCGLVVSAFAFCCIGRGFDSPTTRQNEFVCGSKIFANFSYFLNEFFRAVFLYIHVERNTMQKEFF